MRAKIAFGAIVGIWSLTLLSDLWSTAWAATIYWDGSGASWNSVSSWSTVNNATTPDPAAVPGAADLADFDIIFVSNQTVDLNAAQSALGLVFNNRSGSTTIQSGTGKGSHTLTLGSSGITVNTGAGADTISAAISLGSAQMWTNNSSSTLTINGNIADATNLLTIAGSGNTSLGGVLGSGSGGLTMSGSGTLTLSGANNYSGATMVNSGVLVLGNASALGTTAGSTTVAGGATLDLDGQTVGAEPLTIAGAGVGGNGALVNSSATAATFGGTIANQTFTVGGTGDITLSGSINGTATLTKIGAGTLTLSGTTDNTGLSLAVDAGTVVLAKTSSHAPNDVHAVGSDPPLLGMVISGGTVQLGGTGGDQIYDSANVTVTSGAFDTNSLNETFATLSLQGTGIGGAGALVNSGGNTSFITPTNGTVLTGNTTIGTTSNGGIVLNNAVSGNFALTKVGFGTLELLGTNTFSGGLIVQNGALQVEAVNNASTSGPLGNNTNVTLGSTSQTGLLVYVGSSAATNMPFVLATGGTGGFFSSIVGANLTLNGTISGSGALLAEFGTVTLGGSNTFTGGLEIANGDLRLANPGALNSSSPNSVTFTDTFVPTSTGMLSLQGNSVTVSGLSTSGSGSIVQDVVQNASATAATLTVSNPANIGNTFAGILQDGTGGGALSLVKSGQGSLTLTGVNTFSGGLTVANGALQIQTINNASTNGVLGNNTSVTLGSSGQTGTLLYTGDSSASTNMPFVLATGGTGSFFDDTVGPGAANLTLNGRISGAGTLNAVIGTVTLGGSNTFTGGVTISDGDLRLANPGALNSSSPNSVTFDDTFVPTSTGMLSLQGNSVTVSGLSTNVTGSIVQDVVQNASATAATLTVSNTGNNTFAGILQDGTGGGALSLVKSGAGTLTLSGANTYSGVTTVNAGKLAINGSIVSNVTVNAGGTLQGTGSIGGLVTVKSGAALSPGNSPGIITVGSLTLNSGAQTNIELGGSTRGSQYDAILSSGNVNLGGTLIVSLINGFAPVAGSSFDILDWGMRNGKFASVSLPSLSSGLVWSTLGLYSSGELFVANSTLLPGDFNRDGIVDARDIAPMMQALTNLSGYQSSHGNISTPQVTLLGDINGDGQFTNADLQSFLNALKSGGGSSASVPEPASCVLAFLALALVSRTRFSVRCVG